MITLKKEANVISNTSKVITNVTVSTVTRIKEDVTIPTKTYGKATFWALNRRIHDGFGHVTRSKLRFQVRITIFIESDAS